MTATAKRAPRSETHRKQRTKNLVMFMALFAFVIVVYFVSLVRMGGG